MLKQLFAEGEGKISEWYIHFTFSKYLLIFIHYYVILPLLKQWNILNMPW